jgi:thiol-disulfide isomerase/thioredoxin/sulfur carrier protein ThiS
MLEKLFAFFTRFSPKEQKEGFFGGFLLGMSLGLIWTPCVGPILASVISLALTGSVNGAAFFITLAYATGTGIPMLAFTYGGRQLFQKIPWLLENTGRIQRGFGVVMILTGLAIMMNVDRCFQTWVLETFPQYGVGLTRIEENEAVKQQLDKLNASPNELDAANGKPMFELQESMKYPLAPELNGGTAWLNSEPLRLSEELRGKVVLIDFWTYSCINCIRTFPYVTQWYEKYKDQGFVIVGVHSPEFEFEKKKENVLQAMSDFDITYPVVQDNEFKIWRAYSNRYWPAHYLIDKEGRVRYTHFGEGKYQETENKIRELLGEEPMIVTDEDSTTAPRRSQTVETYLGYGRAESYSYQLGIKIDEAKDYSFEQLIGDDNVALSGRWTVREEHVRAEETNAVMTLNFLAQKVHLVLASKDQTEKKVRVLLNGKPLPQKYWTTDMNEQGEIVVTGARKYDIIDLGEDYGRYDLDLVFEEGIEAYAFTFGS